MEQMNEEIKRLQGKETENEDLVFKKGSVFQYLW